MLKSQQLQKLEKKISTDLESLEFFDMCLLNLKTFKYYFISVTQNSTDNQANYWVKDPHSTNL